VSIGGGRPRSSPIVKQFSFLWSKAEIDISVTLDGKTRRVSVPTEQGDFDRTDRRSLYPDEPTGVPAGAVNGSKIRIPLGRIAYGRSGDKGDSVNIGIIARNPKWVPVLRDQLTAARVHEYFAHLVKGPVTRFDVPGIYAFNFLLLAALAGGGMASPRSDPLGKAFAQMLLDIEIDVPAGLYSALAI
jgi:hypothetical protein